MVLSRMMPPTVPTPHATTSAYMSALTQSLRSWTIAGRSRMSRIGWKFWSDGSLMNHIAPGRMRVRHPAKRMAN